MKLKYFVFAVFLFLLSCNKSSDDSNKQQSNTETAGIFNEKAQSDTILYSIESVCKRKDIDKIHSFLKSDAVFIIDGDQDLLSEIVDKRDKERALGGGSYEEILSSKVKFYSDAAVATIKTKWSGSGILSSDHIRLNTVILEKTGDKWLISYWHASRGN